MSPSDKALHHLIQDSALTLAVTTAQDVHLTIQFPHNVFLPAPKRVNLDPLDIVRVLLHSHSLCLSVKITQPHSTLL